MIGMTADLPVLDAPLITFSPPAGTGAGAARSSGCAARAQFLESADTLELYLQRCRHLVQRQSAAPRAELFCIDQELLHFIRKTARLGARQESTSPPSDS